MSVKQQETYALTPDSLCSIKLLEMRFRLTVVKESKSTAPCSSSLSSFCNSYNKIVRKPEPVNGAQLPTFKFSVNCFVLTRPEIGASNLSFTRFSLVSSIDSHEKVDQKISARYTESPVERRALKRSR